MRGQGRCCGMCGCHGPRCAVNRLPSAALPRSGWLALGIVYGIGRALNVDTA